MPTLYINSAHIMKNIMKLTPFLLRLYTDAIQMLAIEDVID